MFKKRGIKLHILSSLLVLLIIISTVAINWFVSVNVHRESLTENYLNNNYNYAKKVTSSAKYQLEYMKQNIVALAEFSGSDRLIQEDIETWYDANKDQFNSIFTTDETGSIQLISPKLIRTKKGDVITKGTQLDSSAIHKALEDQKPHISKPYRGISGRLVTMISAPIFDRETGEFRGVTGGTIYLDSKNVLKNILGSHEYEDHSYVYVVDEDGRLIYHPEEERLGDDVSSLKVVQQVMKHRSGSKTTISPEGEEYLAGYSYVDSAGWGIIAQTPTSIIDKPLRDLSLKMIVLSFPFLIIILVLAYYFVSTITKPIKILADFSNNLVKGKDAYKDIEVLNVNTPVLEVQQLYYQGVDHLRRLNEKVKMDGLTEIANRRMYDEVIELWMERKIPFSLIMIDIDHFKKVNDTYGHLVGDQVLKYLTQQMVDGSNQDDLRFRYGGEEFGILAKNQNEKGAYEMAENLRVAVANTPSPTGEPIKISLGVTSVRADDEDPKDIFKRADDALYQSKETGRNNTTVFKGNTYK